MHMYCTVYAVLWCNFIKLNKTKTKNSIESKTMFKCLFCAVNRTKEAFQSPCQLDSVKRLDKQLSMGAFKKPNKDNGNF